MKISEHSDHTEKVVGVRAEDIHKWIDGFFDAEGFDMLLRHGQTPEYDPYDHRKFRHCQEALQEALEEFKGKYTEEQIKGVFETHIKDDYDGYLPDRSDFTNGAFSEKYHENEERYEDEPILSEAELSDYFKGHAYANYKQQRKKVSRAFHLKIVVPSVMAMIVLVLSLFFVVVPDFQDSMMDDKKEMIKELTASAVSVIDYYIDLQKKGKLTKKQAQQKAIADIEHMHYGIENKDYFWITDMHPRMIMHPYRRELIGKDLSNFKDVKNKSGKLLFMESVNLVKEKHEGYIQYLWQWMDDESRTAQKLSYVKGIPEWDWIVGTGVYIHDVDEQIAELTNHLLVILSVISIILILALANLMYQSHKIEKNKMQAEMGLVEAKDRYRALVEASNEGYILLLDGEIIYSNHTIQRMLGYNEKDLNLEVLFSQAIPDIAINRNVIEHLHKLKSGELSTGEFEAQLKTRSGALLDMIVATSRIFFAQKNGYVISIRKITRIDAGNILYSGEVLAELDDSLGLTRNIGSICRPLTTDASSQLPVLKASALLFEAVAAMRLNDADVILVEDDGGEVIGELNSKDIALTYSGQAVNILLEIQQAESLGHIVRMLNQLPDMLKTMTRQRSSPTAIRKLIGKMFDAAIVRFIELAVLELGPPPVKFAFLSLGSNARHEMTMFSDQDNALIYADVPEADEKKTKRYFLKLSDRVCSMLNQAGYPYCPGGIMATNPKWCLSETGWKNNFKKWLTSSTPQAILEVNVFFDIYCVYGDQTLAENVQKYALKLADENPEFYIYFARNCLLYTPPLNLFGGIKTETWDGAAFIKVKECIKPIVNFARIYALKHDITATGTIARLEALKAQAVINDATLENIISAFTYLWRLRFYNQLIAHAELRYANDDLSLNDLNDSEKDKLKHILAEINLLQSKLSFEFLGVDMH
jgi:PAS domain S-box-containing protein